MMMRNDWMTVRAGHVEVLILILCIYAVLAVISIYMLFRTCAQYMCMLLTEVRVDVLLYDCMCACYSIVQIPHATATFLHSFT